MRTRQFSRTRTLSTTSGISETGDGFLEPPPPRVSRQYSSVSHRNDHHGNVPDHHGNIQDPNGNIQDDTVSSSKPGVTKRTLWQLITLNTVAMGIEFCYATETALVIPTLLQMGLPDSLYSITWIVSPTLGFFLNPVIGSLSDRCRCFWGRRRPFILALCIGVAIGLTLFLNGEDIGCALGDTGCDPKDTTNDHKIGLIITIIGVVMLDYSADSCDSPSKAYMIDVCDQDDLDKGLNIRAVLGGLGGATGYILNSINWETIPALKNAVMLGDQGRVMFIFSLIVGFICFVLTLTSVKETPLAPKVSRKNDDDEERKPLLQDDDDSQPVSRAIPVYKPTTGPDRAYSYDALIRHSPRHSSWIRGGTSVDVRGGDGTIDDVPDRGDSRYNSPHRTRMQSHVSTASTDSFVDIRRPETELVPIAESHQQSEAEEPMSALQVLMSIFKMPKEIRWLCLTHLFSWSGVLTIFLFFTDYVGQVVYNGDPKAPEGSDERILYQKGVQMGCWGMVIFGFSTMIIATALTKLSKYMTNYTIYVWGQTIFVVGMGLMAIFSDNIVVTLALCATVGVQFVTVTTVPFSILAGFHQSYQNSIGPTKKRRGLGTDVACLSGMNFVSQILVSAIVGALVDATGTELTIVIFALVNGFIGSFLAAVFVVYKLPPEDMVKTEGQEVKDVEDSISISSSGSSSSTSSSSSTQHVKTGIPDRELTGPV